MYLLIFLAFMIISAILLLIHKLLLKGRLERGLEERLKTRN